MRKRKSGLGSIVITECITPIELKDLLEDNPLSHKFIFPKGATSKDLVKYLVAEQVRVFGERIDLPFPALQRNFNLLLKKYTLDELKRAIALGVRVANHPFSTKFVGELAQWVRESHISDVQPPQ